LENLHSVRRSRILSRRDDANFGEIDRMIAADGSKLSTPLNNSKTISNLSFQSVRKVYMENQLDLNTSELEYYEEMVNELAEKLEGANEEKDELQSICNTLGDRLQQLSYQKEEALSKLVQEQDAERNDLLSRIDSLEASLAETREVQYYVQ
jgi:chromosome segregation ATPase